MHAVAAFLLVATKSVLQEGLGAKHGHRTGSFDFVPAHDRAGSLHLHDDQLRCETQDAYGSCDQVRACETRTRMVNVTKHRTETRTRNVQVQKCRQEHSYRDYNVTLYRTETRTREVPVRRTRMETRTREVPVTTMTTQTRTRTVNVQKTRMETRTREVPVTTYRD